ncbi:MAG: MipA/OmpV family protein [Campylobacterales bacterium]|nr:MipA/OmpV family protein [Campylobacterales bacterium]
MIKKIILLIAVCSFLFSEDYTLDLGFGVGVLSYPDYIGSKSQSAVVSPYPFIVLKYKNLTIDRNGIQQKIFNVDGLNVKLSGGGMLPSDSTGAREGMKDLDATFELGPTIEYTIYKQDDIHFYCSLPLRAVFSTDFSSIDYVGLISDPKLILNWNISKYNFDLSAGPVWADAHYHEYYYGVETRYVTPQRAYYKAKGGYSGFATAFGISKRVDSFWFGAFVKYYDLNGVVYEESPLLETDHAVFSGVAAAYIF